MVIFYTFYIRKFTSVKKKKVPNLTKKATASVMGEHSGVSLLTNDLEDINCRSYD